MKKILFLTPVLILSVTLAPSSAQAVQLLGRAVLDAATFSPGATSGQQITGNTNGVTVPFVDKQPVQGFSALIAGPKAGTLSRLN